MATNKTLKSYIRGLSDDEVASLFEYLIAEMNRRKAKKQNVDVGFWNSEGLYIEDIQKIDESGEWDNLNKEFSLDVEDEEVKQ